MYYLCLEKREGMRSVRTLSFVILIFNDLRRRYMYMQRRLYVHVGETPSIPVSTGPIPVAKSALLVTAKCFPTAASLRGIS